MQIAAFDADDKADGTGKAPITWIGRELPKTFHRMNPKFTVNEDGTYQEGTGAVGGWEKCELRRYLKDTIKLLVPEIVRNNIVEVNKTSSAYDVEGKYFVQNTVDDMWIPNNKELSNSPCLYQSLFPNNASRVKKKVGYSQNSIWWLRNARSAGYYDIVSDNGSVDRWTSYVEFGVVLCFCT